VGGREVGQESVWDLGAEGTKQLIGK